MAIQVGESARGYQEPFALCGGHGYPSGRPYVYAPARFIVRRRRPQITESDYRAYHHYGGVRQRPL